MSNREIILLTGGARSGKSTMALKIAAEHSKKIFLATAEALDQEMQERIQKHRMERSAGWITIEEPVAVEKVLEDNLEGCLVFDCITLWLSNLMMRNYSFAEINNRVAALGESVRKRHSTTIVVTNEVGMGIVPEHDSGRLFRDLAGTANQTIGNIADRVIFMVSGIPIYVK